MKRISTTLILILVLCLGLAAKGNSVFAEVDSCSASSDPHSFNTSSTGSLSITVSNISTSDISKVRIGRPNVLYQLSAQSADGWSIESSSDDGATYSGGSISPSGSKTFTFNVTTGSEGVGLEDWGVTVIDGENEISCEGDVSTQINSGGGGEGDGGDGGGPSMTISNISISNTTSSSVTVSWTTDIPGNSLVQYGLTSEFSDSVGDSAQSTSHSLTVNNISPSTTYYYIVASSNGTVSATSGENTFTTSASGAVASSTISSTSTSTSTSSKTTPTPTLPPDIDPPTLYIATDLSRPVAKAPFIRGTATDDRNISLIEYSIDGGRNWSSANYTKSTSAKSLSFSFTPVIKDDGNYDIVTRAKDSAGNIGNSKKYVLVFDRIPPKIGGSIITSGPQIQRVSNDGIITLSSRVAYKMFFTSIGGATDITLLATPSAGGDPIIINSQKNDYSSVWGTEMNFAEPGIYTISAEAIDGADNKTITNFPDMQILEGGSVHSESGEVISKGKVSVYYMDPETNMFHLWDAGSYGQINPSVTDEKGRYSFNLPKGQYYIGIESDGFVDSVTDIFSLSESTLINSDFIMRKKKSFSFLFVHLNIPSFSADKTTLNLKKQSIQSKPAQVIGKKLPQVNLMSGGEKITQEFFNNKNTIIGFTNTWLPETQVLIDNLNTQNDEQAIIVIPHESDSYIQTFQKRGDYKIKFASDPDGVLLNYFGISMLPSIVEIDENGIVKNLKIGVSSKEDN